MRGEPNVQEYAGLLGEGLFADNVVLSLIEFKTKRSLGPKEKAQLKRAKHFLEDVIAGSNLKRSVFRSAHDVEAAKAYKSVCSRVAVPKSVDFVVYIKEQLGTVDNILSGGAPSDRQLDQLDSFFSRYSSAQFQNAKSVLETV